MEDIGESMQAIGIGTAAFAVSHGELGRSSIGPVHTRLNAGRFGTGSLTRCLVQTRQAVNAIVDSQDAGSDEVEELVHSVSRENDFLYFSEDVGALLSSLKFINIDDVIASQSLEDELRKIGEAHAPRFSDVVIEWMKSTSDRIMSTLIPARNLESIKNDQAGDLWLLISAMLSTQPITAKWVYASQEKADISISAIKGSARFLELINLVHAGFFELFMKKITDILPVEEHGEWFANMRALIAKSKSININRVKDMKSWFLDNKGVEGYEDHVRTMIYTGLGILHNNDEAAINALQHRLNAPRLAELLLPLVAQGPEQTLKPWERELPFGDFLWSKTQTNGERVYFMANGYLDASTIAIAQKDVHPSVLSEMSYVSEKGAHLTLTSSISSTVRFGNQVCPGDMYSTIIPFSDEDPVRQTLFAADQIMRKKIHDMWCAHPQLIALGATASPLCVAEDGEYVYISCRKSGHKTLSDMFGEQIHLMDVKKMAQHIGVQVRGESDDLMAVRIPSAVLILPDEHEIIPPAVNGDSSEMSTGQHRPQTIRSVLHASLNGSGVKSYHDYIHALRKLGVEERQGNGSHIVLTTKDGGFTIHSHAFRSQGNSPIDLGYVSRDLTQLHIDPKTFLDVLSK